MVPRTRVGPVILLTNAEPLDPALIHGPSSGLLLKDVKKPEVPTSPESETGPRNEAALDFLHQMQAGTVDRDKLGEEFAAYLSDERREAQRHRG